MEGGEWRKEGGGRRVEEGEVEGGEVEGGVKEERWEVEEEDKDKIGEMEDGQQNKNWFFLQLQQQIYKHPLSSSSLLSSLPPSLPTSPLLTVG